MRSPIVCRMLTIIFATHVACSAIICPSPAAAQQYDLFEIRDNDLYWHNTYKYSGNADSLRREVVQMLKSKFFTFNVIRNEAGYNGELRHYKVECRKYGRRFFS